MLPPVVLCMKMINTLRISRFAVVRHSRWVSVRRVREAMYADKSSVHVVEQVRPNLSNV